MPGVLCQLLIGVFLNVSPILKAFTVPKIRQIFPQTKSKPIKKKLRFFTAYFIFLLAFVNEAIISIL
jgi:hypothetical protein